LLFFRKAVIIKKNVKKLLIFDVKESETFMKARHIYIVMTQTGTLLSRLLKLISGAEYNHASISLTDDLKTMYSFGRLNPYNPFLGGFVEESPDWGTFKRFSKTRAVVLSITVSEEQYEAIRTRLTRMMEQRRLYRYNYIGLGLAAFGIYYTQDGCYYCSEFVKDILEEFHVAGSEQLEHIVHPVSFSRLPDAKPVYTGILKEFCS